MSNRERYLSAAEVFVDQQKQNPDVIGLLIAGSAVYGRIDPNSDVDIYVILNADCQYRERGNTWIEGVEIEYFMNPVAQIRAYFRDEKSPHTADMLTHGKLMLNRSPEVTTLLQEARGLIEAGPKPLGEVGLAFGKYFIDDAWKDLQDVSARSDDFALSFIKHQFVNKAIDLFCDVHRLWRNKYKRLEPQLQAVDPEFVKLVKDAMAPASDPMPALEALKVKLESLLGGGRSKEWRMRSGLAL